MKCRKLLYGAFVGSFIITQAFANPVTTSSNQPAPPTPSTQAQVQKILGIKADANRTTIVPTNVPQVVPTPTVPDFVNFYKFNIPRACSPAEVFQGKTSCYMCDADTPNIIISSRDQNAARARAAGGVEQVIYSNSPYTRDQYYNAWSFDTRRNNTNTSNSGNYNNHGVISSIILHGYNLQGIDPTLAPINNRTKCETFRPKYSPAEAAARGDKSGFNGAAILGIGGMAISSAMATKVMNPQGNRGQGTALGGNSNNTVSQVGSGFSAGYSNIATEAFACLEYYTNSNTTNAGGDHLWLHPEKSTQCMQPMAQFYQTFVVETCPYYLCDGNANGVYRPLTIQMRYLFLMQNPFFMYGNTQMESWKIASQRPDYPY